MELLFDFGGIIPGDLLFVVVSNDRAKMTCRMAGSGLHDRGMIGGSRVRVSYKCTDWAWRTAGSRTQQPFYPGSLACIGFLRSQFF